MEKVPLVDVYAHLDDVEDLRESLREAKAAGIRGIVAVGMDPMDVSKQTTANASRFFEIPFDRF